MADDGREAARIVTSLKPDILLLDLAMPRYPGMAALRDLAGRNLPTRVILLTADISQAQSVEALQLGVRGIVVKDAAIHLLIKAVRQVMEGQYWVGREAVSTMLTALRHTPVRTPDLGAPVGRTPRQHAIVKAVATGATNREIARQLRISDDTVKQHIAAAFDKCGVSTRVELALFAVNHQIVEA
jgi:DNA-binding NarL/FixJ family response regulator